MPVSLLIRGRRSLCCPGLCFCLGIGDRVLSDPYLPSHGGKSLQVMYRRISWPSPCGRKSLMILVQTLGPGPFPILPLAKVFWFLGNRSLGRIFCPYPRISLLSSGCGPWKRTYTWVQTPLCLCPGVLSSHASSYSAFNSLKVFKNIFLPRMMPVSPNPAICYRRPNAPIMANFGETCFSFKHGLLGFSSLWWVHKTLWFYS